MKNIISLQRVNVCNQVFSQFSPFCYVLEAFCNKVSFVVIAEAIYLSKVRLYYASLVDLQCSFFYEGLLLSNFI